MATTSTGKERKRPPNDYHMTSGEYTLKWIGAWVVFGGMLWLVNKTKLGHAGLYHLLVLAVLLLVAQQYRRIADLVEPITGVKPAP